MFIGTGKSLVIQAMRHKIHTALSRAAYIVITPTGVSANAVNGSTYHSKLFINTKTKDLQPLRGQAAAKLQQEIGRVLFIIIDEYSMVGCNSMNWIEQRIQEAKEDTGEDFSSAYVYLFGDIKQLPPVGDSPIYSDKVMSSERIRGKMIFDNFEGTIILSQIQRQKDTVFQNVLNNIGDGTVTAQDYRILKTRFSSSLSKQEREKFRDAVHLYSTRLEVLAYNRERLENMRDDTNQRIAIARVPAVHNCFSASQGTINDAQGLHSTLYLAEGVRIMLKINLWTERGLVNGAMGRVVHIIYDENSCPPNNPPSVLICRFDSYNGPFLNDEERTIPIIPIAKSWTNIDGQSCSRVQYPFVLCYGCSIHSSQSLSLDMVSVDI